MSRNHARTEDVSVDAQGLEDATADPIEAEPLRPTVELETQAKVDANHPDAGRHGLTLAAKENAIAREAEKARTRERWDCRQTSDREARTRHVAAAGSRQRRDVFAKRCAAVNPWAYPDRTDPRESISAATTTWVRLRRHLVPGVERGYYDVRDGVPAGSQKPVAPRPTAISA